MSTDANQKIKREKKTQKVLERVTIDDEVKDKLNSLTLLANQILQGISTVTKSNVVNLILKLHNDEFSKNEVDVLKRTHFDVLKCLSWLQDQAKLAIGNGDQVTLKELLKKAAS